MKISKEKEKKTGNERILIMGTLYTFILEVCLVIYFESDADGE